MHRKKFNAKRKRQKKKKRKERKGKTLNRVKTVANFLRLKEVPEKRKEVSLSAIEATNED